MNNITQVVCIETIAISLMQKDQLVLTKIYVNLLREQPKRLPLMILTPSLQSSTLLSKTAICYSLFLNVIASTMTPSMLFFDLTPVKSLNRVLLRYLISSTT